MVMMPTNKFPARYFLLLDPMYRDAWKIDDQLRARMVAATAKLTSKLGAQGYRFIRTPQGGYAPGIFVFHRLPNADVWMPTGDHNCYTPRSDTVQGSRILDLLAELPNCAFLKVMSVAGIDNVANIALPPNQALEMRGNLYLVWYAPAEVPVPFGGAREISKTEFDLVYVDHLSRSARQ